LCMPVYLDCNATTPIEPAVLEEVIRFMSEDFGNSGSRTHEYGSRAKQAVNHAREQIADVVRAKPDEVIFTSGATESNNLAILGLSDYGEQNGRRHIISTAIEHKAVLEPLEYLAKQGFEVTFLSPTSGGYIDPEAIKEALRNDTLLVSVMHVNNETGILQPIPEIAAVLENHPAYFHVDAAQGFGKQIADLQSERIDLISISGHKIYAPKGVGALITRRRGYNRIPLKPLTYGGGQERGLRPGTMPVSLVVGLGLAAELAVENAAERAEICQSFRRRALAALLPLEPVFNGDPERMVAHTLNISFPGIDSEALMVALKDEIAISNGSACTSHRYEPSHVLLAMNITQETVQSALRISWCHMTNEPDWAKIVNKINRLR
jgi:cysteine desulfurase